MDYKKCCIDCGFHFFDENECPNCFAEREYKEYEAEWDRQLRLLERFTLISNNDSFWMFWDYTWFRNICQQVSPEIYDWYISLEIEKNSPEYFPGEQLELNLNELPF